MVVSELDTDRLATMLRALGHPARLDIIRTMAEAGDASCMDLTRHVDLAQSTVSEHLRVLKEAGLIRQCGPGSRSGYCLSRDALLWLKQNVIAL
jgi:ArsR family transcriptional regulator, arsenate/arsenite/antimonite-responsive transcriptional repressor